MGGDFDLERYRPFLERQANLRAIKARMIDVAGANQPGARFWYVVETFHNCERAVQNLLVEDGVQTYLPLVDVGKRLIRGRMMDYSGRPAMPGYVMVCILPEPAAFVAVGRSKQVVGFVGGMETPHRVSEEDLNRFKRWLGEYDASSAHAQKFQKGDQVRFQEGLFIGYHGRIVKIRSMVIARGEPKIAVEGKVEILIGGQARLVDTPLALLEKV